MPTAALNEGLTSMAEKSCADLDKAVAVLREHGARQVCKIRKQVYEELDALENEVGGVRPLFTDHSGTGHVACGRRPVLRRARG